MAHMDDWHLRLSSWALSSIGRAMGAKPRDAGSSPVEPTFFSSKHIIVTHVYSVCTVIQNDLYSMTVIQCLYSNKMYCVHV